MFLKNPAGMKKLCRVGKVRVRTKIEKTSSLKMVEQKQGQLRKFMSKTDAWKKKS